MWENARKPARSWHIAKQMELMCQDNRLQKICVKALRREYEDAPDL
jgi:hypothetical protein